MLAISGFPLVPLHLVADRELCSPFLPGSLVVALLAFVFPVLNLWEALEKLPSGNP